MIIVGDIVKFAGPDADLGFGAPRMGDVVSSTLDDKDGRWHWVAANDGTRALFTESELIVVRKKN